jgi:hypothetical protein
VDYHRRIIHKLSSPKFEPTTFFRFVATVPVISLPKEFRSLRRSIVLRCRDTETIESGLEPRSFAFHLSSCNLFAEVNKFCLGAILQLCTDSRVIQKSSSSRLEIRTFASGFDLYFRTPFIEITLFLTPLSTVRHREKKNRTLSRVHSLCFCHIAETNDVGFSVFILSCLVSKQKKPPPPEIELGALFPVFCPPVFSSWHKAISMQPFVHIGTFQFYI